MGVRVGTSSTFFTRPGHLADSGGVRGQEGALEVKWAEVGGEPRRAVCALPGWEYRWDLDVPERALLGFAIGIEDTAKIRRDKEVVFELDVVVDGEAQTVFSN